jgi:hypothetical protein
MFEGNSRIRRKNAETFRLSTLKVARKSFVFKGDLGGRLGH